MSESVAVLNSRSSSSGGFLAPKRAGSLNTTKIRSSPPLTDMERTDSLFFDLNGKPVDGAGADALPSSGWTSEGP